MKKKLSLFLICAFLLSAMAGCSDKTIDSSSRNEGPASSQNTGDNNEDPSDSDDDGEDSEDPGDNDGEDTDGDEEDNDDSDSDSDDNEEDGDGEDQPEDETSGSDGGSYEMKDYNPLKPWHIPRNMLYYDTKPNVPDVTPNPNPGKDVAVPLPFNRRGFTLLENADKPGTGLDYNTHPSSLSYREVDTTLLNGKFKAYGVEFTLAALNATDNNALQLVDQKTTIPVDGRYECDKIALIGVCVSGGYNTTFRVNYADGSWDDTPVFFYDWCDGGGGGKALSVPHANWYDAEKEKYVETNGAYYLRYAELDVTPGRKIKSVTCNYSNFTYLFCMTLVNAR